MLRSFRFPVLVALILTATLALVPQAGLAAGKPGESGFLSLRLGVGTRETAMGGTGVAATTGAAAIYWNPAKLPFIEHDTDLLLQHQGWLGLFHKEAAALAHRTNFGELGFFFSGFYSDDIERYGSEPVGVPEGTFAPYDVVLGVSFARKVYDTVAVGVTIKSLYEKIDVDSGTGLAFDLFLAHRAVIEGLYLAASVTNIGQDMTIADDPFNLPTAVRLGAAYDPAQPLFAGKLTLAADLIMPNDGNDKASVGAEFRLLPELALRVGSKVNYDSQGLTAGFGLRRGALEVGYAFEDMDNDLDPAHKFSLELHY